MTLKKIPPGVPYPSPINKLMPLNLIKSSQSTTSPWIGGDCSPSRWRWHRAHSVTPHPGRVVPQPSALRGGGRRVGVYCDYGRVGYESLKGHGYKHKVRVISGSGKTASALLPRVHRVASLLKRWLLGTHQGGVSQDHLEYYLDEFTFRFNRRTSRHRGKLFYRLLQQAVSVEPVPLCQR